MCTHIPTKQRALVWKNVGDNPYEFSTDAPVKQPNELKDNQALVQVFASGLNPLDSKMGSTNWSKVELPGVPGVDISGKIVAVANGVTEFKVGDEIFGCNSMKLCGAHQEYAVVNTDYMFKKPQGVTHEQAASLGLSYLCAFDGLHHVKDKLKAGATVFVPGGSGGVGHYIVGVAKAFGAKVITSASKDDAIKLLKDTLKADHVLNHAKQDIVEEVLKLTNGKGADIVYDATYSESSFDKSIQTVAEGGQWIVLGGQFAKDDSKEAKALAKRHASAIHADMSKYSMNPQYVAEAKSFFGDAYRHATEWIAQGKLHPIIQSIKLEQVQETLELVAKGKTGTGKVVAKIRE